MPLYNVKKPSETHVVFIESLSPSTTLYTKTIVDIPIGSTFTVSDSSALAFWCDLNTDYVIGSGESWIFGLDHRNSSGSLVGFPAASYLFNDISAHTKLIIAWDTGSYPLPYTFPEGDRLIVAIAPDSASPATLIQFNVGLIGIYN